MSRGKSDQMVAVHWIDAAMSTTPHWQEGSTPTAPKRKGHMDCVTVGFMTHLDEDWCQLIATKTKGGHAHLTEIPVGMIKRIDILAVAGKIGG